MNYETNNSLNLSLASRKSYNMINLNLVLDPSPPISSSSISPPLSPRTNQRIFSCNYCRRKFYSSQALGGHQNAHKLERTLAKKSRELSSPVRHHSGSNHRAGSSCGPVHGPMNGLDHQGLGVGLGRRDFNYGHMINWIDNSDGYSRNESVHQEEISQLDLSLRL